MNATDILIQIGGGVALLLWGVRMVRTGMTRAYGARLRQAIGACAARRLPAFAIGIGATLVLQSSTATTLIVSSFAGRALLATGAGLAVVLGADVGTTLVAVLMSFRLPWLPPLLLMVGVGVFMTAQGDRARHLGRVGDRPRPDAPVAAPADGRHGPVARRRGPGTGAGQPRRRTARGRAGGDAADLAVAFEPGDRAAARLAGGQSPAGAVAGAGPGARRQSRQQPRRGADHGGSPQCRPAHSVGQPADAGDARGPAAAVPAARRPAGSPWPCPIRGRWSWRHTSPSMCCWPW